VAALGVTRRHRDEDGGHVGASGGEDRVGVVGRRSLEQGHLARSLAAEAPADNRVVMDTTQYEDRLAALEARVQTLEDQLAVQQLLNRWGPAVDTGDSTAAAALWTDDGVLQSEISYLDGPAGVAAMVESDGQQALIRRGCAHVQAFPLITVDGDRATAT